MNLVLIGFMGVGKTSVGRRLAQHLGRPFIDTDLLIEEDQSMAISEIFERYGERSFREIEKRMISRISKLRGCVMATGGGAVLDPENIIRLKEHGLLIHLILSLETIYDRVAENRTRPLLQKEDARQSLEAVHRLREPLYHAYSDIAVDRNRMDVDETVEKILEAVGPYKEERRPLIHPGWKE